MDVQTLRKMNKAARLEWLLSLLVAAPEEWKKKAKERARGGNLALLKCVNYRDLTMAWRKAMKWTPGLDHALSVMLAAVTSTKSVGDQLWIKVVSPASSGKSTLCEALSTNIEYVKAVSVLRGFHAGNVEEGGHDHSLIMSCKDKTLVVKDGDTLLQQPNLTQILAEARDIYDTVSRTAYRVKGGQRDYSGIRMTFLLCGTNALRCLDQSELGERFLDCVIMDSIDDELEDEILSRVAYRAKSNVVLEADGEAVSRQDPDMTLAMQLTGGYVEYLRRNAAELLSAVDMGDDYLHRCTRYGKFVAFMRARPSDRQKEAAEREFAARLVTQHTRLAMCLAVVLNKKHVDEEIMQRVRRIALDTARGKTFQIAEHLYKNHQQGLEPQEVNSRVAGKDEETRKLLRFMCQIGVTELFDPPVKAGLRMRSKWRLTSKFKLLYEQTTKLEPLETFV